jgi:hypothetical protein
MRLRFVLAALCASLSLAACEGATHTVDARFSTPEHTALTLLGSYGLEHATQAEIREHMAQHDRFEMRDRHAYEACFSDLRDGDAASEGVAGFVFGAIAAGRDELRVQITGDRATLSPRDGVEIVMHRGDDGAFRIALADSVPSEVRTQIAAIAHHADERLRRGLPE